MEICHHPLLCLMEQDKGVLLLLYVPSLEPLLAIIWNSVDIGGVNVGEEGHGIRGRHLIIYLTKPKTTPPNLVKELKRNGELSNFKINTVKSEILNISLDKKEELALQREFPFTWGGN